MSLLTALLYGAGGYSQGRQQRTQNQQEQQRLDQTQQYQQSEEARANSDTAIRQAAEARAAEAAQRNKGIDPATGKPFLLPVGLSQIAPGNKGKPATDPQTLAHLYAYANWLTQTGQADQAAAVLDRAKAMEADIRANNTLTMRQNLDLYNQGQSDQRTAATIAGALGRTQLTTDTSRENNENTVGQSDINNQRTTSQSDVNNQRTTGTSRQNTLDNIEQRNRTQTDLFMREYERENNAVTAAANKAGTTPTLPYPALDSFKKGLASRISAVAKHPERAAAIIKELQTKGKDYGYDPEWIRYAVQQVQDAAKAAAPQPLAPIPVPRIGGYVPTRPPNPVPPP